MAHRKPLGTTCAAHFANGSWEIAPALGDYLVSTAGTAYRIVGIAEGPKRVHYTLERVVLAAEEAGQFGARLTSSRVFEFYWLSRERAAA